MMCERHRGLWYGAVPGDDQVGLRERLCPRKAHPQGDGHSFELSEHRERLDHALSHRAWVVLSGDV